MGWPVGEPLGRYQYSNRGVRLEVTAFLMEVTRVLDCWQEADVRQRRWVTADQAHVLLCRAELRELLAVALERIQKQVTSEI